MKIDTPFIAYCISALTTDVHLQAEHSAHLHLAAISGAGGTHAPVVRLSGRRFRHDDQRMPSAGIGSARVVDRQLLQ